MIQLEEVHIEEVRGIRKLTLSMGRKSFAIHGPNGSGKSGVVDAIEFCLTGDMTRLSGRGTSGISVKEHGPHVDARDYPDKAFVRLKVYLPGLDKTATVTRRLKAPKTVKVEPSDADIRGILDEVALHPEVTLTRRQIIKFILTEASTRSKDIQTLLRLEAIDQTRASLKTATNKTNTALNNAQVTRDSDADSLRRHLDVPKLTSANTLAAINGHRRVLGLDELTELTPETSFTKGMSDEGRETKEPEKESAARDVKAVNEKIEAGEGDEASSASVLLDQVRKLTDEPELFVALQRRVFVETGLGFADSDECPLCDKPWDLEELRTHLREKLEQSKAAERVERELRGASQKLSADVEALRRVVVAAQKVAGQVSESEAETALRAWAEDLAAFKTRLESVEGAMSQMGRLSKGWMQVPENLSNVVGALTKRVEALPDRSATATATKSLIVAQERLTVMRQSKGEVARRERASTIARSVYNAYCDASKKVLEGLYADVEDAFAKTYRIINRDDEGAFTAKLSPSEGKVDLTVDFHERGLFHPGAYHSEGHQDGMGLCLYLALMRQLLGDDFRLAVLDDVVMSIDKQHRNELCALLKKEFPDTQFIITTHDEAWLRQMQSAKLVTRKASVTFRGWTIDDGPRVNAAKDAWEEIDAELANDRVSVAAGILRRYLEFVFGEIGESLGAPVPLKLDGDYDLGDLLPSVVGRFSKHLAEAAKSAKAWDNAEAVEAVEARQTMFRERNTRGGDEQWVVNKAVHYNDWADFAREDFEPVVDAFKDLVECFRCKDCGTWLCATPRRGAKSLHCDCSKVSINLTKPKAAVRCDR